MADNTTGLPVQTLSGQFVSTKIVDTGGTNVAAVSAAGRLSVDGTGGSFPITDSSGSLTVDAPVATPVYVRLSDGAAALVGSKTGANSLPVVLSSDGYGSGASAAMHVVLGTGAADYTRFGQAQATAPYAILSDGTTSVGVKAVTGGALSVAVVDGSGTQITSFGGGTQYVGDAVASGTPTGTMAMGLAHAAAPADVSADNDAVAQWFLRNGSTVMNIASGGTLITVGAKTSAASLPVVLASDQAALPITDNASSLTVDAPVGTPVYVRIGDGAAALIGQKAMAASLPVVVASDQSVLHVDDNSGSFTVDAPVATPVYVRLSDGAASLIGQKAMAASVPVVVASDQGALTIGGAAAADAGLSGNPIPIAMRASAAAPSDMTADNDTTIPWVLRNGSQVVNLASAGTLITIGQKAMASSVPVTLPSDGYGADATHVAHVVLNTGAADYTLFGQTQATAPYSRISDGTTVAGVIVATTALKVDIASLAGSLASATVPMPVRLTDGAAFYSATSIAPASPHKNTATSAALGAGATGTMNHYVTSGKTGQLIGMDVASTVPLRVQISTVVTGTPTSAVVLFAPPFTGLQWRAPYKTFITQASSDATSGFQCVVKNLDAAVAADVYSTGYWDEV